MEESLLWKLIARKLSGEASWEEIEQLSDVLRNNPHAQVTYECLSAFWEHPAKEIEPENIDEIFNTHLLTAIKNDGIEFFQTENQTVPLYKRILKTGLFKAAAIIIGIAGLSILGIYFSKSSFKQAAAAEPVAKEIETSNGTKTNTILPDGSKVWLNSGSKLTYKTFDNSLREVMLEGEAYFDIIKDAKRPFIVHTNVIDIRVLGTAFNVKSYPNDKTVEASLVRGLIEVTRIDNPSQKVLLKPNEKITVIKKALPGTEKKTVISPAVKPTQIEAIKITGFTYAKSDNTVVETSWTQNKLAFEDIPFFELAHQLERWYGVQINFRDEKVKNISFRGSFVNETILQALEALKLNGDFDYTINNNEIEIFTHK